MRTVVQDKYFLRDLHREIDLYDRKLIHASKHEVFATDALRDAATRKLTTKRDSLAATARTLAASGIEFDDDELPRSFRPEGWAAAEAEAAPAETAIPAAAFQRAEHHPTAFGEQVSRMQSQQMREEESPLATALGSWQDDLAAYKKKRQKAPAAAL